MNLLKTALATALIYMGTLNVQPFGLFPASVVSVSMFILIYLLLFGFPLSQFALKLRPDRDGPKRLLFVSPVYKPYIGGVERVIERVSTELSKMRVFDEIGILTTRYDYTKWPPRNVKSLPTEEVIDGVRVFRVNHYLNSFRLFYHFAAGIFSPHAKRIIRKFDPDVIHFTFGDWFIPNLIVYLFTRDRARHVYSVFYHELSADPKFLPMRLVNRFLTANVDYTHVATEHGKRGVAGAYGTPLERVKVIPLGSDLSNRRAENRPQRRTGAFTILSVGRLERLKGQQDLLQAYHALKKEVNRPLRLVLVGGPGNHAAEITRYIGTHRLEDVVETPGPVTENELNGFYQDAHVFALLSRAESFGLVYVEAMAHGLPVVAYDISPVNEVLSRGAIFVQPGDIKGVKSALASLIQDESYRVELGRQGREHTRTHYRWSRTASELNKLYHGSSW